MLNLAGNIYKEKILKVRDLNPNPKNPRKMNSSKKEKLKKALDKFGDLSGIVYNAKTKRLVSGHQRSSLLPPDAKISIEKKFENPTQNGTVSQGFIEYNGEKYSYREVFWDEKTETEALLAANKHSGEWDASLLRLNFADFPDMSVDLTGFDIPELQAFDIKIPEVLVSIPNIVTPLPEKHEESDEAYLKNEVKEFQQIDTERPPSLINYANDPKKDNEPAPVTHLNPFEEVEEKMDVTGKRFVIIIDCDSDEHKKKIKELIRPLVEQEAGKFF